MVAFRRSFLLVSAIFLSTQLQAYPGHWNDFLKRQINLEDTPSVFLFLAVAELEEIETFLVKSLKARDRTDKFGLLLAPRFTFGGQAARAQKNFRSVARRAFKLATPVQFAHLANLVTAGDNRGMTSTAFSFNRSDFWAQIVYENLPRMALKNPADQDVAALRQSWAFRSPRGKYLIEGTSFDRYGVLHLGQLAGAWAPIERLDALGDRKLVNAFLRNAESFDEITLVIANYVKRNSAEARLRRNWPAHRKHLSLLARSAFEKASSVMEWMAVASIPAESFAHSKKIYAEIVKDNFESLVRLHEGTKAWHLVEEIPVLQDDMAATRSAYEEAAQLEIQANLSVLAKSCRR